METQLLLLKTGVYLITQIETLDEEPAAHLVQPYSITSDGMLEPWPLHTVDEDVLIYSDTIATILEPKKEILEKYKMVTK
jgi:hypothetical protein|tara:strand:- start:576 stop:815 length:240 start_codon:yes stop_codon:yes gene_type:complete